MPEFTTTLPPAEALERISEYLTGWTDDRLPQSMRDQRVLRLSLHDRVANALTIRFSIIGSPKLLSYADCVVESAPGGSLIRFALRGVWRPRTVGLMVFALLCLQIIYELIFGAFDQILLVIAVVVPSVAALMAHVEGHMVRKKFTAGIQEALQMALHAPETRSAVGN